MNFICSAGTLSHCHPICFTEQKWTCLSKAVSVFYTVADFLAFGFNFLNWHWCKILVV
jgi:hypothetical protein